VASSAPGANEARGVLRPVDTGAAAPQWAMPEELLRQASRRLVIAGFGMALIFAVG
jgi:hypothetical protein